MSNVTISLNLPEEVVTRAQAAGLLTDERVAAILLAELERINRLFETADRLAALEPPLTQEEIDAEIAAHRGRSA